MAEYLVPVDIGNRALDHCGVPRITSFADDTKAAGAVEAVYDQLRTAELRRNVWRFATRKVALRPVDTTTMVLVPTDFDGSLSYPQGSIVTTDNLIYIALQSVDAGVEPGTPNEAFWAIYFGPLTVTPYDVTISYYSGELVYHATLDDNQQQVVNIYQCLTTGTLASPLDAPPEWDGTITYNMGDTVTDSVGGQWQSVLDVNINNVPLIDGGFWQPIPDTQGATQVGQDWLQITASVRYQRIQYPIGAGPRNQSTTRNVFRLPSGYLRKAPQDPKQGNVSYLGAPSGFPYDDWVFEGSYIISRVQTVIIFRFVADVQDVSLMDPMFCEGLGARIGLEICEPLTQSDAKLNTISQIYKTMMGEARAENGIEEGTEEEPLDDWIVCRL